MKSAHVWKKAPKGWECTHGEVDGSPATWCKRQALVACEKHPGDPNCYQGRCSRHKPRKRGGK